VETESPVGVAAIVHARETTELARTAPVCVRVQQTSPTLRSQAAAATGRNKIAKTAVRNIRYGTSTGNSTVASTFTTLGVRYSVIAPLDVAICRST
jgi:hypothetical protein